MSNCIYFLNEGGDLNATFLFSKIQSDKYCILKIKITALNIIRCLTLIL